ncbi:unnamed protein product [Cladocopium goreaui]|uniref:Uncharacterized protein n=1 Tax=Cladocopium goreaui TaxID=2562237 RepID=A0A9P1DG92_9DINO|nr:unnamed protein product [Cladocopium goreaui]
MQLFPSALQFSEQLFPSALQFSERRFYTCSHPSHAQVVGTACSGSGAPCHALAQLVGDANYKELFASEIHAGARTFLLENYNIEHLYHNMLSARKLSLTAEYSSYLVSH